MILIADSGSTKCHWAYLDSKKSNVNFFNTIGINPHFLSELDIIKELQKTDLNAICTDVKEVFFLWSGMFIR